ncbi:uncharacterized protein EDB91DRAFT_1079814 [Suillus paluster]|uniref:uncharacterized protein n=1 Tax=Suillus paluster TaxID=48578 RepID=UPI001B887191|nr:uncharacterized protein EDB91DRAFT_1079814 [Suillus paluster]KAG1747214.1 hypothetical protein EDB91DRAFT_1079814 [Suillus paluster]
MWNGRQAGTYVVRVAGVPPHRRTSIDHDLASSPDIFKNASETTTIVSSSAGLLIADVHGWILYRELSRTSVRERITHTAERNTSLLSTWDLGKTDKRNHEPVLLRSAKVQHCNKSKPYLVMDWLAENVVLRETRQCMRMVSGEGAPVCIRSTYHPSTTNCNYVIVISSPSTVPETSSATRELAAVVGGGDSDASTKVTVFDTENKVIGYIAMFVEVQRGYFRLGEYAHLLYQQRLYPLVLSLAQTQHSDKSYTSLMRCEPFLTLPDKNAITLDSYRNKDLLQLMALSGSCKMTIHAGVLIGRDRRLGPLPTPDRSYRETYSLSRVPSTSAVVSRSRSVSAFAPTNNYYAVVHVAFAYRRYPVPLFTLRLIPAHYIFYQTITIAIMRRAPLKYLTKRNFQGGGNVPTHIVWTGTKSPTPIGIIIMPASSKIYRDYTWAGSIPPLGLVPRPADMLFVEGQTCICYLFASRKARPQSTPSTQAEAAEVHSFLGFRTDKAEAPRLAAVPIPNSFDSFKQSGQFKSCYVKSGGSKSGLFCRFQALHDIRREVKNNAAQTMHHRGQEERSASRSVELGSLLSLVTNRSDTLKSSKDNEYQIQERDGAIE